MGTVGEKCTAMTRWHAYKDFKSIPPVNQVAANQVPCFSLYPDF